MMLFLLGSIKLFRKTIRMEFIHILVTLMHFFHNEQSFLYFLRHELKKAWMMQLPQHDNKEESLIIKIMKLRRKR